MESIRKRSNVMIGLALVGACAAGLIMTGAAQKMASSSPGHVRTYYIGSDEVAWNYTPGGKNVILNRPFNSMEAVFTESGPHRIGSKYLKAVYREYTDATFTHLKPRPSEQEYLGILGPVVHAEVGDTVKIVFRNHGSHPYSIHPHGVFYSKDSEGVGYDDGSTAAEKAGDAVAPGATYTYTWQVPERAGPGRNDPSSVVWLYHSHVDEMRDVNSGLIGALVVTRRGMARPDGSPRDVDRELVNLYMIFNENDSWYLEHNVSAYCGDPKGVNRADLNPISQEGVFTLVGSGFADANTKATINGYLYGNMPVMTMRKGERVRWYLVTLGFAFNFHTPHWHGNVVTVGGQRTDVLSLSPAQMLTADMQPDDPGLWMVHCHVSDHMHMGMVALYRVTP